VLPGPTVGRVIEISSKLARKIWPRQLQICVNKRQILPCHWGGIMHDGVLVDSDTL